MKTANVLLTAAIAVSISTLGISISSAQDEKEKMLEAPADVKAAPEDAQKTDSGLASKVLKAGNGTEKPSAEDTVTVHYTGWTTDGKMFDSSVERGSPTSFPLNGVIKGWTEGLQLMVEGEKRRFWIPGELAYGNEAQSGRPSGTLVFDVELLSIKSAPKTPEDVAAAPADAEKTDSGLAFKVLTKGTGTAKPGESDMVTVHYSGWTTDGKMFDSSVSRGEPTSFPLNGVIKGWTEGLQLMVEGEKRRFWIPGELAYGNEAQGGRPSGLLVFDVELLEIPTKAPEDVAKAPDDAEKTASGIASKVIEKGIGTEHPEASSIVHVHYTGWTTDGKMFDSSIPRRQPAVFPLDKVIKGWTEGVQLMVEGETRRFWIPGKLAYGDKATEGRPSGTLVFDVELLKVEKPRK